MSQAWSIGKIDRFQVTAESKKDISLQNVAPGNYKITDSNKPKQPQWSMGSKTEIIDKKVVVSPHNYTIPSKVVESQGKSFGLKLETAKTSDQFTPGPGQYVQEKSKQKNYQFSMGARLKQSLSNTLVPGPGAYEYINKTLTSTQSMKFGTGTRSALENVHTQSFPGPLEHSPNYKVTRDSSPNYGFGSKKRDPLASKNNNPGPGNYTINSFMGKEGRHQSMHSLIKLDPIAKEQLSNPGPGNYESDTIKLKTKNPSFKLGSSHRFDLAEQKRLSSFQQAPNNYKPNFDATAVSSSKWGFGSDKRKSLEQKDAAATPSPNQYKIPQKLTEGPKYGMGMRLNSIQENIKVGPGQYDTMNKDNVRMRNKVMYSMGTSKRPETETKMKVPGPGNYEVSMADKKNEPKFGFGSATREHYSPKKSESPGPGNYKIQGIVGSEGSKATMHAKFNESKSTNTPGPGNYESHVKHLKQAPSYGMGARIKDKIPDKVAGPGANAYNPSTSLVLLQSAKYGFGSGKRKSPVEGDPKLPGPGSYKLKSTAFNLDNPKFHIGQKFNDKKDKSVSPGAGSYDPDHKKVLKNLPSYSMLSKLNEKKYSVLLPGPGNYDVNLKVDLPNAPKYRFGSSTRNQQSTMNGPGPGAYKIRSSIGDVPDYSMPNRPEQYKYV